MKSVVLHEVVEKNYFLGAMYLNHNSWEPIWARISPDSHCLDVGGVGHEERHVMWETEFETNEFTRELKIDELIHTEGKDYRIIKVSHEHDGKILYYIDKKVITESDNSKKSKECAEQNLEVRKSILADRKNRKEEQKNDCLEDVKISTKKKWFHFIRSK